jgi:hypothetical protein
MEETEKRYIRQICVNKGDDVKDERKKTKTHCYRACDALCACYRAAFGSSDRGAKTREESAQHCLQLAMYSSR